MRGVGQTVRRASSSTEDFRGDYEQLAAMMRASWDENAAPPFLYTAEFLADAFTYPDSSFSLAPTIYHGSEPVAFVLGCPRRVRAGGAERRVLISTFLTVASEQKSSGYGIVVWSELMRRAAEAGFDAVVNYCVEGEAMDRIIGGMCRSLEVPVLRAASFSYLSASLRIPVARAGDPRPRASPGQVLKAASDMPHEAQIARLWTEDEAAWQLSRLGAVSVAAGSEARPAVLTGYVTYVADAVRTRCLVVEDVLWGGLGAERRVGLVRDLIAQAAAAGARVAMVPVLGYSDMQPFLDAGFVAAGHTTHAYLAMWSGPAPARYYLDVT